MLSGMCTIEHVSSLDGFLDCCSVVVGVMIAVMSRYLTIIVDLTTLLSDMYVKMGGRGRKLTKQHCTHSLLKRVTRVAIIR